jgi:starch synthase
LTCDAIIAVSPNYAYEILTVEHSFGLSETLRTAKEKLTGILNGLDPEIWNPEKDRALETNYHYAMPIPAILKAKEANKKRVQQELGLNLSKKPLISCITRVAAQKGPEEMKKGLLYALGKGFQSVLLGTLVDPILEPEFRSLKKEYEKNSDIHFNFAYNEPLSRLLFAASDFLLVPSHFEPCGLTQLIAMRYGTIPIVKQTGGLADTIFDLDTPLPESKKNGFVFDSLTPHGLLQSIDRAFKLYQKQTLFGKTAQKVMSLDYSWKKSATDYVKTYEKIAAQEKRPLHIHNDQ